MKTDPRVSPRPPSGAKWERQDKTRQDDDDDDDDDEDDDDGCNSHHSYKAFFHYTSFYSLSIYVLLK